MDLTDPNALEFLDIQTPLNPVSDSFAFRDFSSLRTLLQVMRLLVVKKTGVKN
ncbi:unnamed protein product [Brassica napus]|uniref:(rape) hypothetical protein n=1 Tax=Brassica napus TaxID=3708 RepID=A0A816TAU4_BRANA|nr:unnamed protein product [Brassica napus]